MQPIEKTAEEELSGLSIGNGMKLCFSGSSYLSVINCPTENDIRDYLRLIIFMVMANFGFTASCCFPVAGNVVMATSRKSGLEKD